MARRHPPWSGDRVCVASRGTMPKQRGRGEPEAHPPPLRGFHPCPRVWARVYVSATGCRGGWFPSRIRGLQGSRREIDKVKPALSAVVSGGRQREIVPGLCRAYLLLRLSSHISPTRSAAVDAIHTRGRRPRGQPSGGGKPPHCLVEVQPVKLRSSHHGSARFLYASATRSRRPLWSPEASLEPEDGTLHLRRAQRHPHPRPVADRPGPEPRSAAGL